MTIPRNIKDTLRYKHLAARTANLPAYRQEEALRTNITNGPQWRIDAVLEGISKTPYNWNYINQTEVMKHAAMLGRLQTVERISDIMKYQKRKITDAEKDFAAPQSVQAAFHVAARHGRYRTADALFKRGAGPMYVAQGTPAAIYGAVTEGDTRKMDYLIRRGASKDYMVNIAASSGKDNYMKTVKYLVEHHKAGVGHASEGFWTPFLTAVKYGRDDLALYLLDHGATPQNDNSAGEALYSAVGSGNLKMVGKMIELGFRIDQQTVQHAVYEGKFDVVKLLVEKGGARLDEGRQEVLMLALVAPKKSAEMTQYILDNGGDARKALSALQNDKELYRYGSRDQMIAALEAHLAPNPPAAPKAPAP